MTQVLICGQLRGARSSLIAIRDPLAPQPSPVIRSPMLAGPGRSLATAEGQGGRGPLHPHRAPRTAVRPDHRSKRREAGHYSFVGHITARTIQGSVHAGVLVPFGASISVPAFRYGAEAQNHRPFRVARRSVIRPRRATEQTCQRLQLEEHHDLVGAGEGTSGHETQPGKHRFEACRAAQAVVDRFRRRRCDDAGGDRRDPAVNGIARRPGPSP